MRRDTNRAGRRRPASAPPSRLASLPAWCRPAAFSKGPQGQLIQRRKAACRTSRTPGAGAAPPVDLGIEKKNGDFIRALIESGTLDTVHDISDGGITVALAEMAITSGIGAQIVLPGTVAAIPFLFGEDQGLYLVAAPKAVAGKIVAEAVRRSIFALHLGVTGGAAIKLGEAHVDVAALKRAHEAWLPGYMAG